MALQRVQVLRRTRTLPSATQKFYSRSYQAVIRVYDAGTQRDRDAQAQGRVQRMVKFHCTSLALILRPKKGSEGPLLSAATARLAASESDYRGKRVFLSVEEILSRSFHPSKTTTRKGKIDEKASLNRIGGRWIGFRSGAAF